MKSLRVIFMLAMILMSTSAHAQWVVHCTNCSEWVTQALDRITNLSQLQELYTQVSEAIEQTQQQIQMVTNTFDQLENMIKNTVSLPGQIKSKLQGEFNRLMSLTRSLDTLRGDVEGLSQIFDQVYTGRTGIQGIARSANAASQYREMYSRMSDDGDRAQKAALQVSGQQIQELEEKAAELDSQLNDLLDTPEGQMQAIQAGNQLAGMQLHEMQKLRQLLAVAAQADVQKMAEDSKRQQIKDEENAKELEAFQRVKNESINKTQF